jgi:hypothetical protein
MTARTRSRYHPVEPGEYWYGTNHYTVPGSDSYEYCSDTHGNPHQINPLFLYRYDYDGDIRQNGSNGGTGAARREAINLPLKRYSSESLISFPGWSQMATLLASRTNPSRPSVNLPVFFAEFREIPSLIRLAGRTWAQKAASANLGYRFGWKPFISDVRKMLDFTTIVEKRSEELERLKEKGVYRRMTLLDEESSYIKYSNRSLWSTGWTVTGHVQMHSERQVWGTIRWKPSYALQMTPREDVRALARRQLLAMTSSHITQNLWEALPWSWLIDWFANVGDYIQATNNSLGHSTDLAIMTRQRNSVKYQITSQPSWLSLSGGNGYVYESKARQSDGPGISASIPFLSGGSLSILGSLAILRGRR